MEFLTINFGDFASETLHFHFGISKYKSLDLVLHWVNSLCLDLISLIYCHLALDFPFIIKFHYFLAPRDKFSRSFLSSISFENQL